MNPADLKRISEVFEVARRYAPTERGAFLDRACADHPDLRAEVESLLASHYDTSHPLTVSAVEAAVGRVATDVLKHMPASLTDDTAPLEGPGTVIGRYTLRERIGEGGFGVVYRAEQAEPVRREVALKIIKLGMDTKQVVARFEAERQALALMDHPHIARVFDGGATSTGRPYFVMELVKGVPITEYCDQQHLTTNQRLELFGVVCHALQHAHQKGIIHRDIKPSNVLVASHDGKPVPKIIDFGIVKAMDARLTEKTFVTEQHQLIGTPEYMSPEQATVPGTDVDTRSDIYALGVLLYELLTGATPFDMKSVDSAAYGEIQRIIIEQEPLRPSTRLSRLGPALQEVASRRRAEPLTLRRRLRGDLDWIVMKALEKDRTRRYESADSLAQDIERHLAHEPVLAGPPTRIYRFKKFAKRHMGVLVGATTMALVVTLAAVVSTIGFAQARAERDRAVFAEHSAEKVTEFLSEMLASADPGSMGKDVTLRAVLDEAAEGVDQEFAAQPLIQARIRTTLGKTYRALAEYAKAEPQLSQALQLRQAELGPEHPATLKTMNHLALLYDKQGRLDDAESLYLKALEIRRRVLGVEHNDTLSTMNNLAMIYTDQRRYDEAEPLLVQTLGTRTKKLGEEHQDTLLSMNNLASLYWDREEYDRAEPLYLRTLELRRKVRGENHPQTLRTMGNLCTVYLGQKRYDQAEALWVDMLERARSVWGEEHPETLGAMNNIAALYYHQKKYEQSADIFEDISAVLRRTLDPGHWKIGVCLSNRGACLLTLRRFEQASEVLIEAYDLLSEAFDPQHERAIIVVNRLIVLYDAWGKSAEAAAWRSKLPPSPPPSGAPTEG